MRDPGLRREWLGRSVAAALSFSALHPVAAADTQSRSHGVSGLSATDMAYLQQRIVRDGIEGGLDRRVTDALGLTTAAGPPLIARTLGLVNPSHGDVYFLTPLPDGRLLVARREWTGRISYWLLLSRNFIIERAVLAVSEGAAPLRAEQAEAERGRIIAFFRSNVPAIRQ